MRNRRIWGLLAACVFAFSLGGCDSGNDVDFANGNDGGGGGGGGGPDPDPVELRLGAIIDGTFVANTVAIDVTELAAGGQTGLRVDLVDADGLRVQGTSYTAQFFSDCVSAGTSIIDPSTVSNDTGRFDSAYQARGCSGDDLITARIEIDSDTTLVATGTVSVQPAELGSLSWVSSEPSVIGMTGSSIPGISAVTFKLINSTGTPVSGATVDFTLTTVTSAGGARVSPVQSTTNPDGEVQTFVIAGSAQSVVRVTATTSNPVSGSTVSTQSENLAISTGLPDADSVTLGPERFSISGRCAGESTGVTMRLADRYNNPVPAGTTVAFYTEGGKVGAQCVTQDPAEDSESESGVCTSLLNVQSPVPDNARVTVLATAIGEETFSDTNGNGFFDDGDVFSPAPPFRHADLSQESFLDANENAQFDAGEFFVDSNNNQAFDATGDGEFTGYVCDSPGENCRSDTVLLSDSSVVVFSTEVPVLESFEVAVISQPASYDAGQGLLTISPGGAVSVTVVVRDTNGNPLTTGTTFELDSNAGSVSTPFTAGPINTNSPVVADNTYRLAVEGVNGPIPTVGRVGLLVNIPSSSCEGDRSIFFRLFSVSYFP